MPVSVVLVVKKEIIYRLSGRYSLTVVGRIGTVEITCVCCNSCGGIRNAVLSNFQLCRECSGNAVTFLDLGAQFQNRLH